VVLDATGVGRPVLDSLRAPVPVSVTAGNKVRHEDGIYYVMKCEFVMSEMPKVVPGDWISVGEGRGVDAVVSTVRANNQPPLGVVYLNRDRAIYEGVVWSGSHWEFAIQGTHGGYADKFPRLAEYVRTLRAGRW